MKRDDINRYDVEGPRQEDVWTIWAQVIQHFPASWVCFDVVARAMRPTWGDNLCALPMIAVERNQPTKGTTHER